MNEKRYLIIILVLAAMTFMTGCEYDGPTAMYDQPQKETTTPVITGFDPAEALGGANYITIQGTDFSDTPENNYVYVDGDLCEIVANSTTTLKIRRPNTAGDSTTVKVVNTEALKYATFSPYKISTVYASYGDFVIGDALSAMAVDNASGNLYVVQSSPRTVYKITLSGEKTELGEAGRTVTDATVSPDGKLIFFVANKSINQMDVNTGEETEWFKSAKRVSFGDFDDVGNLYTGGSKTDLMVVTGGTTEKALGEYASDAILSVHVANGYVYVAAERAKTTPAVGIWMHEIKDAAGTLGAAELVLDWSLTGDYAAGVIQDMAFAADGMGLVGTDQANPLLVLNADGSQDILYKSILPANALQLEWGPGNFLYMLQGGDDCTILKIDMGKTGAS